ncbi:WD40-repeat-containing domain protein [Lineolata rhizophorae]|uniref:WD40-repeat-containing domain protein n=1 Tax=Lineolata rhizophorae TaxID=578093 RepID=A0A6A6NUH3_9PEZI|nr:WD40-repeat-containing domain protein [Lineolata rhizophorae]
MATSPAQNSRSRRARPPQKSHTNVETQASDLDDGFHDESDDSGGSDRIADENAIMQYEKSDDELEMERVVFGDSIGFREGLKSFAERDASAESADSQVEGELEGELEGLDDDALFFVDTGAASGPVQVTDTSDVEEEWRSGLGPPVWEDSDDERVQVSLADVPRSRKLRRTADEDVVSGKEYARRLRKQFERLYPTPAWAIEAAAGRKPKKRRRDSDGSTSSSDEGADAEDAAVGAAQPLARLLQTSDGFALAPRDERHNRVFRPDVIDIQRLKDIPGTQPSAVSSLSIHPSFPLLLSSGPSGTLYLHHLMPSSSPNPSEPHPLLTSLHLTGSPLTTTAFHPSKTDTRLFLSSPRRRFHVWDLSSGRLERITRLIGHQHAQRTFERFRISPTPCPAADGAHCIAFVGTPKKGAAINVLATSTLQWVASAVVDSPGGIADFAWWADGQGFTVLGKSGEVTEWSLAERRTMARWTDEGAVGATVIALGGRNGLSSIGGSRWAAVGSESGIVNVYDRRSWSGGKEDDNLGVPPSPSPLRALKHLTVPISHLSFSPNGQVLAVASRWKGDALRLVHLPSASVYRNWPTNSTPLGRISSLCWGEVRATPTERSRDDADLLLAVGNEAGKIRLWKVVA